MGETTLRQALDAYKTIYMPYRNFANRTRIEYQNDLEDLLKYLQRLSVDHVSGLGLPIIERYVAQLEEKGFASLTRKRKVVAIRSFLLFLYEDNYIQNNVAAKVVLPFVETTVPQVLTKTESQRLELVSLKSPRDFAIIELVLQTGIRLSEIVRLTLDDLEIGRTDGSARIGASRRKKERTVPLNLRARVALQHYLHTRTQPASGILFLNRFGKPLGERGVQKILKKYLIVAKIRGASVHTLRHTFAAQCLAKGMDLEALKNLMGLQDIRSASVYLSLSRRS
jgi:integrase/recombinase XerD